MLKKVHKFFPSFILSLLLSINILTYGPFSYKVHALNYSLYDVCVTWANHSNPERAIALADLIIAFKEADLPGIAGALGDLVMSSKTSYLVQNACEAYVNGGDDGPDHGGHGTTFQLADDSGKQDQLNGNNYNYYTNSNYNTTSNYSVVNTYSTVNNETNNYISYTYNDNTYNYAYYYEDTTYNITNNTYNFHLTNNNYLSVSNTYNSVNIIDSGNTRTLYYELPDGRNSMNLTEEEALNGYKTSLSVSSYDYLYDDDNLVALFHFDGNEYDSAYPSNSTISFVKNSVQYVDSNQFNQAIAFDRDFSISLNKSGDFYSFRFYPLLSNVFSFNLMGSDLGSCQRIYNTITQYDQFFNDYYNPSSTNGLFLKVNSVYFLRFGTSNPNYLIGSSVENIVNYVNSHDSINWGSTSVTGKAVIQDDYTFSSISTSISAYRPVIAVDNGDYSSYISGGQTVSGLISSQECKADIYDITGKVTNRSYNYINTSDIETDGICNFINFNMWNYCAIDTSGNVFINGMDTNIDVSSSSNFNFSVSGDGVTYVDELAVFQSNRSFNSPSYPYDSNIVYSVPEYNIPISISGIYLNQHIQNGDFSNNNYWTSTGGSISVNDNTCYFSINNIGTAYNSNRIQQNLISSIESNHIFYLKFGVKLPHVSSVHAVWFNGNTYLGDNTKSNVSTDFQYVSFRKSLNSLLNRVWICPDTRSGYSVGDVVEFSNIVLIDLTQMFGAGFEPSTNWCDTYLDNYIDYNSGALIPNPYNISSSYDYISTVISDISVNNQLLIQSIIPVNSWKFGGFRPSSPANGDVFVVVDDLGYITSVQQFNGIEWVSVNAGLYNVYLGKWLNAIGFNIFNNNWEYTDYKYKSDDRQTNIIIQFFTDTFNKIFYSDSNPSEQQVISAGDNNDEYNSDFNNNANTLYQYENQFNSDFTDASNNLVMENPNEWGDDFLASANWVKNQYDRLTVGTPIGKVLGFSLVIGFVLLIVGRFMR